MLELVLDIQVEAAGQRCKCGVEGCIPRRPPGERNLGDSIQCTDRWYLKPWDWIRSLRV